MEASEQLRCSLRREREYNQPHQLVPPQNDQDRRQGTMDPRGSKGSHMSRVSRLTALLPTVTRKVKKKKSSLKRHDKERKEELKQKKKEKNKKRQVWQKGDALLVKADDAMYTTLLKEVRENPELKDLKENVVKTRRTQYGEMLLELKKDPTVKSSSYEELVAKSLGETAKVKALTQEAVVECRDMDEITTVEELRQALQEKCSLDGVRMEIRLRKAYGGTQTATIRLPLAAADKLLEFGKVKVALCVCPLRAATRANKQTERCFKCLGFGHYAGTCKGPDRSKLCYKCGENGHIARDCTQRPKCMLCGEGHATCGFKCPAYKKAIARR